MKILAERDLLAAIALHAILSRPDHEPEDVKHNAIVAYRSADAMLAQREAFLAELRSSFTTGDK